MLMSESLMLEQGLYQVHRGLTCLLDDDVSIDRGTEEAEAGP